MSDELRNAAKQEPEKYLEYVLREDRSVDEFLASNYTFVNETLASAYKISGVKGAEMRKVALPPGDVRGGILTMGSVLMVTSNPTRTSPVKRGKWILENILAAPTPPPPPNVPALEDAKPTNDSHIPTLRETLAIHREDAKCASCHDRMDPPGLALENFNALGQWRAEEYKQKIDPSGQLATGETFTNITDLKHILVTNHKLEFYRCLTEKLLTYALGRGLEYYDVPTVDKIVEDLDRNHGAFSALLNGVIESAPFQQQRLLTNPDRGRHQLSPSPGSKHPMKNSKLRQSQSGRRTIQQFQPPEFPARPRGGHRPAGPRIIPAPAQRRGSEPGRGRRRHYRLGRSAARRLL